MGGIPTGCHGDEAETRLSALRFTAVRTDTRFRKLNLFEMCIAVWIPNTELLNRVFLNTIYHSQ